ncbi:DDE superfamily endonuclease [Nitzschia inconspicua]|uniref:DDE superfamily endonuclease n=1 Tax=Nitzschia inconspicua TaxID=303405 RepID=A0A9K3LM56_9STRA|nr:DDE superfamily endonuclease [Nitzschia inconspicua]
MDQTPVFLSMQPKRTLNLRGETTVNGRNTSNSTNRVTASLAVSASGLKLKPMLMAKALQQSCTLMHSLPISAHLQRQNCRHRASLRAIPPGCTGLVQPIDVGVGKPFKDRVRQKWIEWMMQQDAEAPVTTNASRADCAAWVAERWRNLPQSILKNSWRKSGFSWFPADVDDSEDADAEIADVDFADAEVADVAVADAAE